MAAFSERRYEVNGVDTAVFSAGDGPPLVFFHGGGTMSGLRCACLPLAERARLIVPAHHPGFGASADDESIESRQDYHLHYLELFDQLGLGELALVGHSLGGAVAAAFAALHPERLRRLVLAAPDRLIPVGQAAVWAEHIAAAEIQTFPGAGHLLFDESASAVEAAGAFAARP